MRQYTVQCGLIWQCPCQHGVFTSRVSLQVGEREEQHFAQSAPYADLITVRRSVVDVFRGHCFTAAERRHSQAVRTFCMLAVTMPPDVRVAAMVSPHRVRTRHPIWVMPVPELPRPGG